MADVQQRKGPLAGVQVLDLSRLYPGAFCTSLLADLGAEVLKVEAPGSGDGLRPGRSGSFGPAHVALNRGKRSMTLNLKADAGRAVLASLARTADVLVESHRPGSLESLGVGYPQLQDINPGLVWCSLTGFGIDGPRAQQAGHDITYLGVSGVLSQLGGSGPVPVPDAVVSLPLAATMAVSGILAALLARQTSGTGCRVDANMADSAMWTVSESFAAAASSPMKGWGAFAGRNVYRCADGRSVTVAATEPKSWARLCAALDLPELADRQIGTDEPAAIARISERLASQPAAHWVREPGLAGGIGPVNEPGDLLDDEQLAARGGITTLAGSETRVLGSPLRLDDAAGRLGGSAISPPPDLGEHTEEVLAQLGFDAAKIAELRTAGAI